MCIYILYTNYVIEMPAVYILIAWHLEQNFGDPGLVVVLRLQHQANIM
jgi:hypothetical protein